MTDGIAVLRRRYDLLLLAALAVLAAGAFGVAALADAMTEAEAQTVDERLLLAFRTAEDLSDPVGGTAVRQAVRDLTALGGGLLTSLVTLLTGGYFVLDKRPRTAALLLATVGGGAAVVFALKLGLDRPRPDLVPHVVTAFSPSFPSGHAAVSAVVYLTHGALLAEALPRRRLQVYVVTAAMAITLGVGISRVFQRQRRCCLV